MKQQYNFVVVLILLSTVVLGEVANAQFFIDDFGDGDATDGVPAEWLAGAFPGGTRDASSGDYVLSNPTGSVMSSFVDRDFSDVSIRTQMRMSSVNFDFVGVFARSPSAAAYIASLTPNGTLGIGLTDETGSTDFLSTQATSLNVAENDVHMQFDLFGTTLSLTAWEDGSPRPENPQVVVDDATLTTGSVGVFTNPDSAAATFRDFAAVPEPTAAALMLIAVGLFGRRRRVR